MKKRNQDKKSISSLFKPNGDRATAPLIAMMFVVTWILVFGLFLLVCTPKRYDLSVGSISRETITATKDVLDEVTTEERKSAAASSVEPSYRFADGIAEQVLSNLDQVFRELRVVQQYGQTFKDGADTDSSISTRVFSDDEVTYAQNLLTDISLTKYQIRTLLRTENNQFEDMVSTVETAVANSMSATIREGQISQAIQNLIQIVGYRLDVSLTQNIVPVVLRACIQPNMLIDQEATEIARIKARDNVDNVMYLQGQNIVREGEKVNLNQLEMLRTLGLLKNNRYELSGYGGAAVIIVFAMLSLFFGLYLLAPDLLKSIRKLSVVLIIMIITVAFAALSLKVFNAYFVPCTFAAILITVLLGTEAAYAVIIPSGVLIAGLTASSNSTYLYEIIMLLLINGLTSSFSVLFLKKKHKRMSVIVCSLINALMNVIILFSIHWLTSTPDKTIQISNVIWSCGNALFSGILVIALQPVFEYLFNLATASRLLELVNPDQPLLRRLLIEAPGTYHHSIIVANLAEAAAEKIGGNPLLARAGAYYHDIGKLKRPLYFKENQIGDNPHDGTDPYVSAAILTSHTSDGASLAQEHHLPEEIKQIILQHHGDTPVMFFYHKALQLANGNPVDIKNFRYSGQHPATKEAAIVMLADTMEAAVRSMKDPTVPEIKRFIERLIRGKLEDGQLSDAPILLCHLDEIADAFTNVLKGVFHERIEYPNMTPASAAAVTPAEETAAIQKKQENTESAHAADQAESEDGIHAD